MLIFSFTDPATTDSYTLSLHDALPILTNKAGEQLIVTIEAVEHDYSQELGIDPGLQKDGVEAELQRLLALHRSEEHTSELQSLAYLVCRLLLEKKKKKMYNNDHKKQL